MGTFARIELTLPAITYLKSAIETLEQGKS